MADDWFYVKEKKKQGPVSFAQLRDLVLHGQIARADMILPGGSTKWQAAESVDGLFPGVPDFGSAPPPPPPAADEPSPDDLAVFTEATSNRMRPHQGGLVVMLGASSIGSALIGLLGIIFLWLLPFSLIALGLGVPVIFKAGADLHKMKLHLMDASGDAQTRLGRVLGIIGAIMGGVEIIVAAIIVMFRVEVKYF